MKGKKGEGHKEHGKKHHEKKHEKHEEGHYKRGGGVHHKAEGHKEHHRADKRARGGRMTPKAPLSGAMPKGLPGGGKAQSHPDKSND